MVGEGDVELCLGFLLSLSLSLLRGRHVNYNAAGKSVEEEKLFLRCWGFPVGLVTFAKRAEIQPGLLRHQSPEIDVTTRKKEEKYGVVIPRPSTSYSPFSCLLPMHCTSLNLPPFLFVLCTYSLPPYIVLSCARQKKRKRMGMDVGACLLCIVGVSAEDSFRGIFFSILRKTTDGRCPHISLRKPYYFSSSNLFLFLLWQRGYMITVIVPQRRLCKASAKLGIAFYMRPWNIFSLKSFKIL